MKSKGADIPDVECVIQFGVPLTMSMWLQGAGRAGRNPSIQAEAIMLIEKSVFEMRKKKSKKDADVAADDEDNAEESGDKADDNDAGVTEEANTVLAVGPISVVETTGLAADCCPDHSNMTFKKKIKGDLCTYLLWKECKRNVTDVLYDSPPECQTLTFLFLRFNAYTIAKLTSLL